MKSVIKVMSLKDATIEKYNIIFQLNLGEKATYAAKQ